MATRSGNSGKRNIDSAFSQPANDKSQKRSARAKSGTVKIPSYIEGTALKLTFIPEEDRVGSKEIMNQLRTNHKKFVKLVRSPDVFTKYYVEPGTLGAFFSRQEFTRLLKNINPLDIVVAKKKSRAKAQKNFEQTYKSIKDPARIATPIGMEKVDYKRFMALLRLKGLKVQDFYTQVTLAEYRHLLQSTKVKSI